MQYVNLGSTGLRVSRLCLGTMTYGSSKWRPWVLDEEAARPFFGRAIEAGINFFDTADMYSVGMSETVVGRALREFTRRDDVVIATKVYFRLDAVRIDAESLQPHLSRRRTRNAAALHRRRNRRHSVESAGARLPGRKSKAGDRTREDRRHCREVLRRAVRQHDRRSRRGARET